MTSNKYYEYEYDAYDGEGAYDYESADYESDYDYESDAGNDDAWGNRDDEYDSENAFLSRTCVSDKPSLDKLGGMTVLAKPVQLAAAKSSFATMMEAKFAAADKVKKEAEELEKQERLEAQRLAEEKMKEELRLKAVVASLPTESRAAKERRLKAEAEEKAKLEAKARKEKVFKATSLGHRRNGGGKSRGRYAAEVDQKVVTERRNERRAFAAMNRKRELEIDAKHIVKVPTVIKLQKPVIAEKVDEGEARVVWAAHGNNSDEFNMTEATKLVEVQEQKAEAAAMAELVELVATKICDDKTTKMERIMAEQKKEKEEKDAAKKKAEEDSWTQVKRSKSKSKSPLVIRMGQTSHRETRRLRMLESKGSESKGSESKGVVKEVNSEEVRTVAHEKLSDKKEIEKNLTKTRLCKSLETGEVCRHGIRCRFAHSLDELVVAKCVFGAECRHIKCGVDGFYKNSGERVCSFIHPGEDKEGFYVRTGLKKPSVCVETTVCVKATVSVKMSPTKEAPKAAATPTKGWDMSKLTAPVKVPKEVPGEGWAQVKNPSPIKSTSMRLCDSVVKGIPCRHGVNCRFSHTKPEPTKSTIPVKYVPPPMPNTAPVCESVALGIPCRHGPRCRFSHPTPPTPPPTPPTPPPPPPPTPPVVSNPVEQETVLRVPKEMFLQAMEMAMKSGKNNIRVEIIDS